MVVSTADALRIAITAVVLMVLLAYLINITIDNIDESRDKFAELQEKNKPQTLIYVQPQAKSEHGYGGDGCSPHWSKYRHDFYHGRPWTRRQGYGNTYSGHGYSGRSRPHRSRRGGRHGGGKGGCDSKSGK
jgi:hypothetical protein